MTNRFRCSTIALGTSALLAFVTAVPATAATIDEVDIFNTLYGTSETTASLNALLVPDAVWNLSGGATVTAEYKEASFLQTFGFYTDLGIGAVQTSLFSSISTNGYLAGSFPPVAFSPGVSFGFYTHPSVGGPYFTEAFTDGGFDHFRTYQTPQVGRFVIFTEDIAGGGDRDINDFVVSVKANAVPEPSTLLLVGTYRRRKK